MKKRITALLAAAAAALMLTGCGDSNPAYLKNITASDYVELCDYSNIPITVAAETEVTDDMVDNYVNYTLSSDASYQEVTDHDTVENGDTVNIDYTGTKDGEKFDGGSATGYDLVIGSGSFIDGFEDGLIGHKVGETVELNLTFPDDYSNTDLAGQDVVFTVTINKIEQLVTPELTDEWVAEQDISNVSTVDEYKDYVRNQLQTYYDDDYRTREEEAIADYLIDNCTFKQDPPEEMVRRYYDNMVQAYSTQISQNYGMDLDTYTQMMGLDSDSSESSADSSTESSAESSSDAAAASSESTSDAVSASAEASESSDGAVTEDASTAATTVTSEEISSTTATESSDSASEASSALDASDAAGGVTIGSALASDSSESSSEAASIASSDSSTDSSEASSSSSESSSEGSSEETEKIYQWIMDDAEKIAKRYIILQAIADKEGLNLSTRELKQQLSNEAAQEGYSSLDDYLKDEDASNAYREYLMSQKVMDWLLDHATVTDEASDSSSSDASSEASTEASESSAESSAESSSASN